LKCGGLQAPAGVAPWDEACVIVALLGNVGDVATRIGSTPEYPTSRQRVADAVLLLRATTRAGVGARVDVAGVRLRIFGIYASYDAVGKFAHCVVEAMLRDRPWSG
jgi:hypothetical protein